MIVIKNSKSKKRPFMVEVRANNGNVLHTSELFKIKAAAQKNYRALIKAVNDGKIKDLTVPKKSGRKSK